jgi:hypothetical protein
MSQLDPVVDSAIRKAVLELQESEALAQRLIAWISAVSDGSSSLGDRAEVRRRFDTLCAAINSEGGDDED